MTKAEQFCKLNGICWHEFKRNPNATASTNLYCCEHCKLIIGINEYLVTSHPTFTDAKSILEVMMKREDFWLFLNKIGMETAEHNPWVSIDYILDPDKLLDEAIRFCKANKL